MSYGVQISSVLSNVDHFTYVPFRLAGIPYTHLPRRLQGQVRRSSSSLNSIALRQHLRVALGRLRVRLTEPGVRSVSSFFPDWMSPLDRATTRCGGFRGRIYGNCFRRDEGILIESQQPKTTQGLIHKTFIRRSKHLFFSSLYISSVD